MRISRWICGHTKLDKIRNEVIRGKIGVASIQDKIREARLRWFGHIRRSMDAPVRRCEKFDRPNYRRSRGRPKKSWSEVMRHDLKTLGLVEDMAQDRGLWQSRIKVADYKQQIIYLSSEPSKIRSMQCVRLTVFTLQFVLLELACS